MKRIVLLALVAGALLVPPAAAGAAPECHPTARNLLVTYQPVEQGLGGGAYYRARLTLENNDTKCAMPAADWHLYFNFVRQPLAVYPAGELGDMARSELASQGLELRRADAAQSGDLYVLEPTDGFSPIPPGGERVIHLSVELWALLKTDAPAGWHIVFDGEAPQWVPARALQDPNDPRQNTAFSGDHNPVETAGTRFAENTAPLMRLSLKQRLVPQPLSAVRQMGSFELNSHTLTIQRPDALANEAAYLQSALADVLTGRAQASASRGAITLSLDPSLDADGDGNPDGEGYKLQIDGSGIHIVGADAAGVLYGIQTLRQLIPLSAYRQAAAGHTQPSLALPRVRVADAPLFGYRGMGIDVARHFESKETIEKFLDLMSFLKMNRLHIHLTDDEGWRLQIPGLPELTSFGAHRGFDLQEQSMLHQGLGSGSDLSSADGVQNKATSRTEANLGAPPAFQGFEQGTLNYIGQGSGFYTPQDFEGILRYANARHIQVIPEFDVPAHARAAVQAMERRYQRLEATDPAAASQYRLVDPQDTSQHRSVQYYTDNLVNPCIESTYDFLAKVVTEVRAMYDAAGVPLTTLNMGGDEAPGPNRWQGSPACRANPQTAGKSDKELDDYFFSRWHDIALTVAPRAAGWEDVLLAGTGSLQLDRFVALPWQNVWGWGREQIAYQFANKGIPVVLAHATNLYMDLAYNKDPNEPGYYWASFVDEKKTFAYQPFDVYANATQDRWGNPFTPDPNWETLTPEGRKNILGMEAQLWGENGKTPQIREYQAFPKLLGVAERAWNRQTPTPDQMPAAWNVFVNTLGQVTFPLLSYYRPVGLDGVGVNYRIPLPGGEIKNGVLRANVRNPGVLIEYSVDGERWSVYGGPVRVGPSAYLRTRAVDGRASRVAPVEES